MNLFKRNQNENIMKEIKANIIESERGWGTRFVAEYFFDSEQERDEFIKKFNDENMNEDQVPSTYYYAEAN